MQVFTKRNITLWLIIIVLLIAIFIWHPTDQWWQIVRWIVIGNCGLILILSVLFQWFFWYRYSIIRTMLYHIAQVYDTPLTYSFTPVSLIKKQLYNQENISYLKAKNNNTDTKSLLLIVHEGQDYEFFHYLNEQHSDNLASVLIYYLQQNIPYEILYEQSKTIHTSLSTSS